MINGFRPLRRVKVMMKKKRRIVVMRRKIKPMMKNIEQTLRTIGLQVSHGYIDNFDFVEEVRKFGQSWSFHSS